MFATITIRRTAAAGAAVSGLLHLLMLGHGDHGGHLGGVLLMSAMAIVCLPCAGHLWRAASQRTWTVIAVMNTAMLAVHIWMLSSDAPQASVAEASATAPAETSTTAAPIAPGAMVVPGHVHGPAGIADIGTVSTGSLAGTLHQLLLPLASAVALTEILLAAAGLILMRRGAARARR